MNPRRNSSSLFLPLALLIVYSQGASPHLLQAQQTPADNYHPAWSHDGTKIAFMSERDGNPEIYLMDADGSNQTRLTDHPAADWSPSWSPDGKRIAFSSDRAGHHEIYVMNADGTGVLRLTHQGTSGH